MEKEIKVGLHNRFDFIRRDAKTGEILGKYYAENIILNNFWAAFLSTTSGNCLAYMHFGSGSATPAATDIKLGTWLGYKDSSTVSIDYSTMLTDGIIKTKKTCRLEDTEFAGLYISEVGFSNSTSGTTGLLTKALTRDENGNIVSIPKAAGEIIDIYATFYIKIGMAFDSGKMRWGMLGNSLSATYTNLIRALAFSYASSSALGSAHTDSFMFSPSPIQPQGFAGSDYGLKDLSYKFTPTVAYDIANKKMTYTIPNVVAANGNFTGGLRSLVIGGNFFIKLPCTGFAQPVITKEVLATGDGVTKDFNPDFGWILNNGTGKVYVNDVEVTATIDYGKGVPRTNIAFDMNIIDYNKDLATDPTLTNPLLGNGLQASNTGYLIFENPYYAIHGIASIEIASATVYASNDLTNWTQVATNNYTSIEATAISSTYKNYRYWKVVPYTVGSTRPKLGAVNSTEYAAATLIHLASIPASGATVALTYQPDVIAKDASHVLNNITVAFVFNEYTP